MLPKTLYETLPFDYAIIGMLAMLLLDNQLALFSGLVLIITAIVVVSLRFYHRHTHAQYY